MTPTQKMSDLSVQSNPREDFFSRISGGTQGQKPSDEPNKYLLLLLLFEEEEEEGEDDDDDDDELEGENVEDEEKIDEAEFGDESGDKN